MNGDLWWGWENVDVLINFAHDDFEQTKILEIAHNAWVDDDSKFIINFSSRAAQPNISKGYLYASQKAALIHLSNNLVYNSHKRCRITTLHLGLLEHQDLPSISHSEVSSWIYRHLTTSKHYDVPEITIQNRANYQGIQSDKQSLREWEKLTK